MKNNLSKQITDFLDGRRIYHRRLNGDGSDAPGRFAIIRGQIIFIELKMRGRQAQPGRLEKHLELMRSGALVLVCDSFDQFVSEFNAYRASIELREKELMRLIK